MPHHELLQLGLPVWPEAEEGDAEGVQSLGDLSICFRGLGQEADLIARGSSLCQGDDFLLRPEAEVAIAGHRLEGDGRWLLGLGLLRCDLIGRRSWRPLWAWWSGWASGRFRGGW